MRIVEQQFSPLPRLWAQGEDSSHQECPTVKRVVSNTRVGNTETRPSLTVCSVTVRSSACTRPSAGLPVHLRMAGKRAGCTREAEKEAYTRWWEGCYIPRVLERVGGSLPSRTPSS